jgi:phage gp45-like
MIDKSFPMRGIITGINGQKAQVFIPLAGYETGFIDSTVTLDAGFMIGYEAIVVFINGDRNQGVIVGVIP